MIRCLILILCFFLGFINLVLWIFASQESGSSVQDDQCPLQLQPHHPHGSWRWHPDSETHGSSHYSGDRRSGEMTHDTWHSLSPWPRLVTAAAARAPWPGLSQSRESSPCLVRARENCPRPACPPIPRLLSGPSATQRSVERVTHNDAHHPYCANYHVSSQRCGRCDSLDLIVAP